MTDWRPTFARRLSVLAGIFVAWVGIVEARLVYLHVIQHAALLDARRGAAAVAAGRSRRRAATSPPATAAPIAMSRRGFALEATRSLIPDPEATASRLCRVLHDCDAAERQALASSCAGPAAARATSSCAARSRRRSARVGRARTEPDVAHRRGAAPLLSRRRDRGARHRLRQHRQRGPDRHRAGDGPSSPAGRPAAGRQDRRCAGHSRLLTRPLRGADGRARPSRPTIDRELQFIAERELADGRRRARRRRRRRHHDGSDERRHPGARQRPDLRPQRVRDSPPTSEAATARRSTSTSRARPSSRSSPPRRSKCCTCRRRGCSTSAPATSASGRARIHDAAPLPGAVVHGRLRQVEQRRRHQDRPGARLGRDQPLRLPLRLRRDAGARHPAPARRPGRPAAAAVQAERAGLGVDGLPDWRHAAADGRRGRLDRQRRRAGRAARRARHHRRRRPHRSAAAGRAADDPDRDRRRT